MRRPPRGRRGRVPTPLATCPASPPVARWSAAGRLSAARRGGAARSTRAAPPAARGERGRPSAATPPPCCLPCGHSTTGRAAAQEENPLLRRGADPRADARGRLPGRPQVLRLPGVELLKSLPVIVAETGDPRGSRHPPLPGARRIRAPPLTNRLSGVDRAVAPRAGLANLPAHLRTTRAGADGDNRCRAEQQG